MSRSRTADEISSSRCEASVVLRGEAVGSHSSNESMAPVFYKKMAFIAFFNAGVERSTFAIYHPTEVGYCIPRSRRADR